MKINTLHWSTHMSINPGFVDWCTIFMFGACVCKGPLAFQVSVNHEVTFNPLAILMWQLVFNPFLVLYEREYCDFRS